MFHAGLVGLLLFTPPIFAARDPSGFEDGSDLESFVTRPDLRAPRYNVTKHYPDAIAPGYWFVAHYPSLFDAPSTWRKEHLPYQTGVHIYDNNGELVWSGARDYRNVNAFDFKPFVLDDQEYLTFYVGSVLEDNVPKSRREHGGVTMNHHYQEVHRTLPDESQGRRLQDVHEFTLQPGGKTALLSFNYAEDVDAAVLGQGMRALLSYGFQEVEISTGKAIFDWEPLSNGVPLSESVDIQNMHNAASEEPWDWFHLNSVDKNADGDYLVSGRHTSTIYKVSGQDGSVIWRLGGKTTDFTLDFGVHFEWQHHAKFLLENETTTIISAFDNAGEDTGRNKDIPQMVSWGKMIHIDHTTMTASLLRGFQRPDQGYTTKLGSVQTIGEDVETSNVFINWGQQSYITEYDGLNRMVLEAKLLSPRMWTYRAYKAPWIGLPLSDPVLKPVPTMFDDTMAITYYVSWNGATEVASWAFYSSGDPEGPFEKLATTRKRGFETSWTTSKVEAYAYVEAVALDGTILGSSNITELNLGDQWQDARVATVEELDESNSGQTTPIMAAEKEEVELGASWLYLIGNGLALYGLYAIAKAMLPGLIKKRNGYLRVASDSNEPILGGSLR